MIKEFEEQTKLVLLVLPFIDKDIFALKGGTAINFFYQNLPRLSVDIDLTYLPIEDRKTSFKKIHQSLNKLQSELIKRGFESVSDKKLDGNSEVKLVVSKEKIQIKVEPNFTLRGTVLEPEMREVSKKISELYGSTLKVNCLKYEEVYAGKICAALDRQYPRDLFDIKLLLEGQGITKKLKDVFLFYLISSARPFHELLSPKKQPIKTLFEQKFLGMNFEKITIEDLDDAYNTLVKKLKESIEENDIELLRTILQLNPQWHLSKIKNIENYPSIKWRMLNVEKMSEAKRQKELKELNRYF